MKFQRAKKALKYILLVSFLFKLANLYYRKKSKYIRKVEDNFEKFVAEEKDEFKDYKKGKRSFRQFQRNFQSVFKDYFIPGFDNDYKPKILRTKSLSIIVVILLLVKIITAGSLFLIYPNQARMSQMISQQILELINKERADNNLPLLKINSVLSASALAKAEDMLINDYFAHIGSNGKMPWDWIDQKEYHYLYVAENLAMNFTSAESAHGALMLSPSHKKNIISDKYVDVGLAVINGQMDGKQTNVLVEIFASPQETKMAVMTPVLPEPVINLEVKESVEPAVLSEELPLAEAPANEEKPANIAPDNQNIEISPNPELESNKLNIGQTYKLSDESKASLLAKSVVYSQYFFAIILAILALALLANIIIRITIQHKSIILQSLFVIMIIIGLIFIKLHFLEGVTNNIFVL